jgi:hypothetical protein
LRHAYDHAARGPWERQSTAREPNRSTGTAYPEVDNGDGELGETAVEKAVKVFTGEALTMKPNRQSSGLTPTLYPTYSASRTPTAAMPSALLRSTAVISGFAWR